MTERPGRADTGALHLHAVERLLAWGFSHAEIASNLGHSEAWVRAVEEAHQAQPQGDSRIRNVRERTNTQENEE